MLEQDTWAARTALTLGLEPHVGWRELEAEYLGVRLSFATNNALAAEWSRFFLGTHFDIVDRSWGDPTCLFHYGTVYKGALHDIVQNSTPTRVQLDRRRSATRWFLGAGRSLTVSDCSDYWYVVDREAQSFVFLTPSDDPTLLRETARQVRSIVGQLLMADGWLPLHASAVTVGDIGLLFPGDKGAGKTTTMLELLGSGRSVSYVSNDRTYGRLEDDVVWVAGYPHTIRLGAGSLETSPILKPHLHAWEHFHATLLPLADQVSHPDKLDLTVRELTSILECDYSVTSSIDVIAFPRLEWTSGRSEFSLLDPDASAQLLAETSRFPDPEGDTWVGTLLHPKEDDTLLPQCRAVASLVHSVQVSGTAKEIAAEVLRYSGSLSEADG